ncbi:YqgE/AlgH family protein [Pedobacter sp. SAFR-022]|uniref:YqgE/AlgH family protein n=1 Tax=Pedobacter sp. SAFR-022 TaxID=3436861 RepID=UPI003F807443
MLSPIMPETGRLLISEPFLNDPNFKRSVILLAEHAPEASIGFVLNQRSNLMLSDLIPEFEHADFPIYVGGPVANDTIHFIHRAYEKMNDGELIAPGIYWGGNFETLKVLLAGNMLSQHEVKFFIGYSGWAEAQLLEEISQNTWIVSDKYDADVLFSGNEEEVWRDVIVNLGPKYAHVVNFPQNPNLN